MKLCCRLNTETEYVFFLHNVCNYHIRTAVSTEAPCLVMKA
uniref:Uncharacterized protein n=1 Tax=Anguilla anguilla TaxID=7936 RepID=A0A0E9TZG1_ANGAN